MRHRLTSIRQALALLGEVPLRKWASIVALGALGQDKTPELLLTCLARARFCELLAPKIGLAGRELDLFLMGLFSAIDAFMDQSLDAVLAQVALPEDVSAAILGANTILGKTYRLVMAFERGNAMLIDSTSGAMKITSNDAAQIYAEAIRWADQKAAA